MLILDQNAKLQLTTSAALSMDVHGSYVETDATMTSSSNVLPTPVNVHISTAVTTDIIAAPASTKVRNIKFLSIRNNDASNSNVVTPIINSSSTQYNIGSVTLGPGEELVFKDGSWFHYDTGMGIYTTPTFDITTAKFMKNSSTADQTGLTAGSANYITGSAITLPTTLKVGMALEWFIHVAKTGAGTSTSQFDMRFGTNGTTGDTSRCSTGALDTETAAADEMMCYIEAIIRGPISASCIVQSSWEFANNLGTTGFSTTSRKAQIKAVQSAAFDITPAGTIVGISMTPGTGDVITVRNVIAKLLQL